MSGQTQMLYLGRDITIKVVTKESAKSLLRADIQSLPSCAVFIS